MLTICSVNIIFYNNKWKSSEKAAAVSLFQSEEFADTDALYENSLKSIKVLVSTYFQTETFITLIKMLKVLCVTLPWNDTDAWQVISRVHCLSKMKLSLSVKLFSFNAILNMINVNCQMKWTLLIIYNNKYVKNEGIINLIDFKNDNLSEKNNFNEVDDEIWEIKVYERLKVLILNCSMFYFKSSFKDLYYVANHNIFLIYFCLSAKIEEYSVNNTYVQNSVQTVSSLFFIAK